MVTETSSKATSRGALGLWIVTSTAMTRGKARTVSLTRSARVSRRATGSPSMSVTTALATAE